MQFTVIAATLALAMGVVAQPHAPVGVDQSKTQCQGQLACCVNKSDVEADGIASGLLTKGLLNNVLGASDQACAKWSLIENLNLLGFTKQGQNGHSCSQTTACCQDGEDSCTGV